MRDNTLSLKFLATRFVAATLAFAAPVFDAVAAAPVAGTTISNVASATYFNTELGLIETIQSNEVRVQVSPVPAFEIFGGETQQLTRSVESIYSFRIQNTGNVDLSVSAAITEQSGDDFDVVGTLYIDRNNNGEIDNQDTVVEDAGALTLTQNQTVSLLHLFMTPASVVQDDRAVSTLVATAMPHTGPSTPITRDVSSTAVIDSTTLRLQKTAAYREASREIDYVIRLRNNGEADLQPYSNIEGETISIDGAAASVVLVRDTIPLHTAFTAFGATGSMDPLYHVRGEALHTYVSAAPADLSTVDAVAFVTRSILSRSQSSDLAFTVRINANVGATEILNTAVGYINDSGTVVSSSSNQVLTPLNDADGTLAFFNPTFSNEIDNTNFDEDVAVQLIAGVCNISPEIDVVDVTVTTALSGDREVVIATETGPNTGIFRTTAIAVRQSHSATQSNSLLEPRQNDAASASAVCRGVPLSDEIVIEPGGYVFDSINNAPVEGAQVLLLDSTGTRIAETDTDATGFFQFGPVPAGTYNVQVLPPASYDFPSQQTVFNGYNRSVDPTVSYGVTFDYAGGAFGNIDIPLDPVFTLPLTIEKSASRTEARRGQYIVYTVNAKNHMAQGLTDAAITDELPPGFIYVEGSSTLDGTRIADPEGTPGRTLDFDLDTLRPETTVTLEYTVKIGPNAGQGDRVNSAVLSGLRAGFVGSGRLVSQTARSTVRVDDRGSVFAEEALVIGRVFLDLNGNGVQDEEDPENNIEQEPGIPGVKIITSNGLSVVTDTYGRYSLFGLRPVTQVFALQRSTLPKGAEPALSEIDDARKPGSRFIDLRRSELRSEDFPVIYTEAVARAVAERRAQFEGLELDESLLRDDLPISFDGGVSKLSSRRETARETTLDVTVDRKSPSVERRALESKAAQKPVETEEQRKARLTKLLSGLDSELGFVGLEDQRVLEHRSLDLVVKGRSVAKLGLSVNGEAVPGTKIATKVIDRKGDIQLFEYIAVPLKAGENTVSATITDPFGNVRGTVERTIYAPGAPAKIEVIAPKGVTADSAARVPVIVRILDAEGRLVRAPADVTLSATKGEWDMRDIREQTPGLQSFIDNGEATFDFIPPNLVGNTTLRVEADFGYGEAALAVSPDLEDRVFVGIVEGAVGFGEKGSRLEGLMERDEISFFEETTEGVRGQLYLKGKILGDSLLTLRYDSDQDTNERLFRDIARDEYYPVYGDNSERGFDAQSSSKLFVKVERNQSYILYGDIAVEPESDAIRLGAFRRSVTGGKARYQEGRVSVSLFAARTELGQRIIEIPGDGVSGPYDIALNGIRDGSEIVELITRDRDQPAVILDVDPQRRLTDYSLDFFSGALIFNRPIPQFDDNLNPVSIRVTYETLTSSGEKYWLFGGEARYQITDNIAIGYREVQARADRLSEDRRTIRSAYLDAKVNENSKVQAEVTQSKNSLDEEGFGYRAAYDYNNGKTTVRAEAAHTDEEFDVPGAYISGGRDEARLTATHKLNERVTLDADSLYTKDNVNDSERYGIELGGSYVINDQFEISAGTRAVRTEDQAGSNDVLSGIAGVRWRPHVLPGASLSAEFEQDFVDHENWRLSLGADYQWRPDIRFYAINEISTTDGGFFGIGGGRSTNFTTKVGAEYRINEYTEGFSEYRDGGSTGSNGGVANGMRLTYAVSEYLDLRAAAEHLQPIEDGQERQSSVSLGGAYQDDERGVLLRSDVEWNGDKNGDAYFSNLAFGYKVNEGFALLARNRLAYDTKGTTDRTRDRLRFGFAYRPIEENHVRALGWYEYEIDHAETTEQAHRWSLGGTYTHSDRLRSNLRVAGEHTEFDSGVISDSNTLHMAQFGMEYEFSEDRLALEGNIALFTDEEFDNYTLGFGAEVKVSVTDNVQVGIGYNHVDLEEDRIRNIYHSGFYLRAKVKLDEDIWDHFDEGYDAVIGANR